MYPFTDNVSTTKKSKGINPCYGIVIHHTAGGTYKSNIKYLSEGSVKSSVHFVIGENGECCKIGDPSDRLWHAGNGSRGGMDNVNNGFLGIEVVGYGQFNVHQLMRLTDLVEYLMGVFNIDRENVVRHSDVTQSREITRAKTLWDGKRKVKKVDIGMPFFFDNEHFWIWREQLTPRTESIYGNI